MSRNMLHPARVAFIALAFVAVACGEPSARSTGVGSGPDGYDGVWRLTRGSGPEGQVPILDRYRITLEIDGNVIGGTAACNQYGGEVEIDGTSFEVPTASFTEMGCAPEVLASESAYIAAFMDVDRIAKDGTALILTGPDSELRYDLVPPPPTADLVGTTWVLESLIYGSGPEGTVGSAVEAELLLREDGTFAATTPCRDLTGEWIERADEIYFASASARGDCPSELDEQNSHVMSVLGDGFSAQIDGQMLILEDRGGLGLHYRARDTA